MSEFEHPAVTAFDLNAVLFALSDPVRLDIVRDVSDPEARTTCHSVAPDMPKSTRSHHLKVLREAGIVRMAPAGRERVLTLRRADLDARWPGLIGAVLSERPALV